MARPRRNSDIAPARERMEDAFWQLLAQREYRQITVTDIVREADVNRNSFYYHFRGLPELADTAIMHIVDSDRMRRSIADAMSGETPREHVLAMLESPRTRERIDRLSLITGPHSSPELQESLREFSRLTVVDSLHLDPDDLDLKTDLQLDFFIGGIMAVLRRWPELSGTLNLDDLLDQDLMLLATSVNLNAPSSKTRDLWRRMFHEETPKGDGARASRPDDVQAHPASAANA